MTRRSNAARADVSLARRAVRGDENAWEELVDTLGPRIFGVALQFARDRARAEDLTQDVFLKLHQNLHKYRGDVSLVAWALRVSRNLCIDTYRRYRSEHSAHFLPSEILESIPMPSDPSAAFERREVLAQVRMVLKEMDGSVALLIALRDFHGLSYLEISQLLGLEIGTVKSRLHRGRRELTRRLGERWRQCEETLEDRRLLGAATC
ncbi:MAG: sigma-70 family RNA polymerase sigma factor [Thermoanaerobaculia bacterium]|nr:sigma-70 family RNA polymerase sigma factor [Thermoanaerobaculia bacterium]